MEARHATRAAAPSPDPGPVPSEEAVDFVRFCYRRKRVGWPELYDEMCAVAGRGAFQGWGFAELAQHGIGFTLFDMPGLAAIAAVVSREERDRSRGTKAPAPSVADD
jgi:hypothetical protein